MKEFKSNSDTADKDCRERNLKKCGLQKRKELELYIHIPFCVRKCAYCDFLSFPADTNTKQKYTEHLISEVLIFRNLAEKYCVSSIFIGGGTPSCLEAESIQKIMDAVRSTFLLDQDAEITLECNPGTLTREKLDLYKKAGINRLSIGLQSTDNEELKLLGRIHTYEEFLHSYELARSAGFTNINIDLINSLPGQNREKFERTLRKVIDLQPEHISAYSLIIEPGTPFYEKYEDDVLRRNEGDPTRFLPNEDEEVEIGKMTRRILEENGYHRYEISNYARIGKECRHNIGYWIGTEYLGLGLGSSGYINGVRYRNRSEMEKYLEAVDIVATGMSETEISAAQVETGGTVTERFGIESFEPDSLGTISPLWESSNQLTGQDQMEEFMFLGLRMIHGVSALEFERRFHRTISDVYGETLEQLMRESLMQKRNEYYFLTEKGLDLANYCMAQFLFD